LILWRRYDFIVGFQQMPQPGQGAFAGVGVEHVGDGDIGVSKLPAGGVNAVNRADLAAEFFA
jgi:hypothetical protein